MKKSIVFTLLILATLSANAQVRFGLKAGPNFSDLDGKYNSSTKTGFHFGALLEIKPNGSNFAIQPELLYSAQGTKVKPEVFEDENINYDYVTVPVIIKYYIISDFMNLEFGPQFAFLVSDNVDNDINNPVPESFDFAITGGLGINITKHIFIQGRYVVGLTEASKDAEVKNRVVQASIGYKF